MNVQRSDPIRYRFFILAAAGLLSAFCFIGRLGAQQPASPAQDQNERIKVTADTLSVDNQSRVAEFSGNVKAEQGKNAIRSDHLKIHYRGGVGEKDKPAAGQDAIEKIIASGNVKITFDDKVAVADEAVYVPKSQTLTLSGPTTRVSSGNDSIAGARIVLERESGQIRIEGTQESRVEAIFYPGEKGGIR